MDILQEAAALVSGDRNADYGHPLDDYSKVAVMASELLKAKLLEPLSPEDCTLFMCCVKLARQAHRVKRDNLVDLAGYAHCTQEIIDERDRRETNLEAMISAAMKAVPVPPPPSTESIVTPEDIWPCGCYRMDGEEGGCAKCSGARHG